MELPPAFVAHNRVDPTWLRQLPECVARYARQWQLRVEPAFNGIEINYVAPAARTDGTRCVLKLSRHIDETRNEIAALQLWDGDGAVRLLESDADAGALLLERLEPGTTLVEVADADDDAATLITVDMLRHLWRPPPAEHGLRPLESWFGAFNRNREALSRGIAGFPAALFQRADALLRELLDSTDRSTTLHGDMHHYNILRAQRADWLSIDPKGLVGDRAFDVCQFFRNPRLPVPIEISRRRLDIFCVELDLDRARTREWAFVHAVLDACWDYEDGKPVEAAVGYAEQTLRY